MVEQHTSVSLHILRMLQAVRFQQPLREFFQHLGIILLPSCVHFLQQCLMYSQPDQKVWSQFEWVCSSRGFQSLAVDGERKFKKKILHGFYVYCSSALRILCLKSFILCWAKSSSLIGKEEGKVSPLKGAVCATIKEKFKGFCFFPFLRFQVQSQACWGQHFSTFPVFRVKPAVFHVWALVSCFSTNCRQP